MITLDRLKYFKTVAQLEHVGQAAKACAISPSVISSTISHLEEELGCSLFDKENKRIKLNENGRVLLEKSENVLAKIANIYNEVGSTTLELKGHYKIGSSPFLMKTFFLKNMLKLNETHPSLTSELMSLDTGQVLAGIISGTIDFGLVFKGTPYNGIEEHILYEGRLRLCAKRNHSIFHLPKRKRIEALNELPAITFKPTLEQNLYEDHPLFSKIGLNPKHRHFYNNNDISIEILKSTEGWAFLPDIILKKHAKSIKPIELNKTDSAPMKVSLVKSKMRPSFLLFDLLKERLEQEFSKIEC